MAEKTREARQAERTKLFQMQLGARKPKNRSSKHLRATTGMRRVERCLSGAALSKMASNGCFSAQYELDRRARKRKARAAKGGQA